MSPPSLKFDVLYDKLKRTTTFPTPTTTSTTTTTTTTTTTSTTFNEAKIVKF